MLNYNVGTIVNELTPILYFLLTLIVMLVVWHLQWFGIIPSYYYIPVADLYVSLLADHVYWYRVFAPLPAVGIAQVWFVIAFWGSLIWFTATVFSYARLRHIFATLFLHLAAFSIAIEFYNISFFPFWEFPSGHLFWPFPLDLTPDWVPLVFLLLPTVCSVGIGRSDRDLSQYIPKVIHAVTIILLVFLIVTASLQGFNEPIPDIRVSAEEVDGITSLELTNVDNRPIDTSRFSFRVINNSGKRSAELISTYKDNGPVLKPGDSITFTTLPDCHDYTISMGLMFIMHDDCRGVKRTQLVGYRFRTEVYREVW